MISLRSAGPRIPPAGALALPGARLGGGDGRVECLQRGAHKVYTTPRFVTSLAASETYSVTTPSQRIPGVLMFQLFRCRPGRLAAPVQQPESQSEKATYERAWAEYVEWSGLQPDPPASPPSAPRP